MAYFQPTDPLYTYMSSSNSSEDPEALSKKIQRYYDAHKQTKARFLAKENTRKSLEDLFKVHLHSDARVTIVGSTLTEFASTNSDLDIVLTAPTALATDTEQYRVHRILLEETRMVILEFRCGPSVEVPFIRGEDRRERVHWEMSFNKTDGIAKTKLLRAYSLVDDRAAPLVVTIKDWAAKARVKDAHDGTLSSFSWTLMVICYLQCGCGSTAVLPCLQKEYPSKYGDVSESSAMYINASESPPSFSSTNRSSLGQLLKGFFQFYANTFKYQTEAISVREGRLISKYQISGRAPRNQWKYFCIEEPYGLVRTNTARAMFKPRPCQMVISALQDANNELSKYNTLNPPLAD